MSRRWEHPPEPTTDLAGPGRQDAGAPRPPRWLRAARIVHPYPTLLNVLTTGALGLIATRGHGSQFALLHLMLAMLAIQACIGTVNDLADHELDRESRPSKPLVSGALSRRTAMALAVATGLAAILLSAGFGWSAWLLAMSGLACGLVYDLRLKRTVASALPFILALPLLPLWIWVALGRFRTELLAVVPLGCLLGLALHLANSLVDYDTDQQHGIRGLAHLLGRRRAIAACWGSFALVIILVGASALAVPYRLAVLLPGLVAGGVSVTSAALLYRLEPSRRSVQAGWGLLAAGGAALALGWLGALSGR